MALRRAFATGLAGARAPVSRVLLPSVPENHLLLRRAVARSGAWRPLSGSPKQPPPGADKAATASGAAPKPAEPPKKFDLGEALYNLGAFVGLSSFMVTDMLALRVLQITSGCMSLYFHGTRTPINRSPILWSLLFMSVNGVNLVRLLMEETPVQFSEEELDVFETSFHPFGVTPRQMRALLDVAEFVDYPCDGGAVTLCKEGATPDQVMLVLRGRVKFGAEQGMTLDATLPTRSAAAAEGKKAPTGAGVWLGELEFVERAKGFTMPVSASMPAAAAGAAPASGAVRALVFPTDALRKALTDGNAKGAREAVHEIFDGALAAKIGLLQKNATHERHESYARALATACADGTVVPSEKRALAAFRRETGLSAAAHETALRSIGWTVEDYEHGSKAGFGVRGDESVESVLARLGLACKTPPLLA